MNQEKNTNYNVHYNYWIGILLSLLILISCLLCYKNGLLKSDSALVSYISFASTIASLLLSLVAIFYAIQSTNSFAGTISELNLSSKDIAKGASEIANGSENIKKVLEDGISKLSEKIEEYGSNTSEKLSFYGSQIGAALGNQHEANKNKTTNETVDLLLDRFIQQSSIWGLFALFISKLSFEHKKTVNLNEIHELTNIPVDYLYGYLVATNPLGVIDVNIEFGGNKVTLTCNYINESKLNNLKTIILDTLVDRFDNDTLKEFVSKLNIVETTISQSK